MQTHLFEIYVYLKLFFVIKANQKRVDFAVLFKDSHPPR